MSLRKIKKFVDIFPKNQSLSFFSQRFQNISIEQNLDETNNILNGNLYFPGIQNVTIPQDLSIYEYSDFSLGVHYEEKLTRVNTLQDFKSTDIENFFKGTANFRYNFLMKDYEEYVSKNSINELNLPNFYEAVDEELVRTPETPFDGDKFFSESLPDKIPVEPINTEKSIILYPFALDESISKLSGAKTIGEYLKKYNPFKNQFPFYAEIIFDNHDLKTEKNSFFTHFTKYGIESSLIDYYIDSKQSLTGQEKPKNYVSLENFFLSFYYSTSGVNLTNEHFEFFQKLNELIDKNKVDITKLITGDSCYTEVIAYKIEKSDSTNNVIQTFYIPNSLKEKTEFIDSQIKYNKLYKYKISAITLVLGAEYILYRQNTSVVITGTAGTGTFADPRAKFNIRPKLYIYEVESFEYSNFVLDSPPLEPEVEIIPFVGISDKVRFNLNTSVGRKILEPITFSNKEQEMIAKQKQAQDVVNSSKITYKSEEPSFSFECYRLEKPPKSVLDFISGKKIIIGNNNSSAGSFIDSIEQNKKYYYVFRSIDYHGSISNPTEIYEVEIVNDNGVIFPSFKIFEIPKELIKTPTKKFRRYLSVTPNLGNTLINADEFLAFKNNSLKLKELKEEGALIVNKLRQAINDISRQPSEIKAEEMRSKERLQNINRQIKEINSQINLNNIGINDPPVWGKKFKIRLTSISTGRKIDINLVFNINLEE